MVRLQWMEVVQTINAVSLCFLWKALPLFSEKDQC